MADWLDPLLLTAKVSLKSVFSSGCLDLDKLSPLATSMTEDSLQQRLEWLFRMYTQGTGMSATIGILKYLIRTIEQQYLSVFQLVRYCFIVQ